MKTDTQLDQLLDRLPREMTPRRDLWADIESQLGDQHSPAVETAQRERHFFTANRWAAVFALALIGGLWWSDMGIDPSVNIEPFAQVPTDQQIAATYEAIKAQQMSNFGQISPEFGNWQYQLAVWDQAISEVQGALNYYPEEPALLAQMQGIYQQQVDYLQLVSSIDTNNVIWMENEQ